MVSTETIKRILKVFEAALFVLVIAMLFIIANIIRIYSVAALSVPFTVLNASINSIPINSGDVYPILLQGLIIAVSMLFGFYAFLLFKFVSDINDFLNKHLSGDDWPFRITLKAVALVIGIFPIWLLLLSMFSAFDATILYSITLTSTNNIPANSIPANVSNVWNSTYYFRLIQNHNPADITAYHYYQSLTTNVQGSFRLLFYAGWAIILILLFYILGVFGFFEYLIDKFNDHPVIGLVIILFITMLSAYLLKLYNTLYALVALLAIVILILLYSRKVQKGNKKDIVATESAEKSRARLP